MKSDIIYLLFIIILLTLLFIGINMMIKKNLEHFSRPSPPSQHGCFEFMMQDQCVSNNCSWDASRKVCTIPSQIHESFSAACSSRTSSDICTANPSCKWDTTKHCISI